MTFERLVLRALVMIIHWIYNEDITKEMVDQFDEDIIEWQKDKPIK